MQYKYIYFRNYIRNVKIITLVKISLVTSKMHTVLTSLFASDRRNTTFSLVLMLIYEQGVTFDNNDERHCILLAGWSMVCSGYSDSSTNKTDNHEITEILLKVVFNTIILTL